MYIELYSTKEDFQQKLETDETLQVITVIRYKSLYKGYDTSRKSIYKFIFISRVSSMLSLVDSLEFQHLKTFNCQLKNNCVIA